MITDNINLVHYLVRRHAKINDSNYEDYFQSGCVGLCLAAERFDESKGLQFSTFAGAYIVGYLKQHYEHFDCSPLKIPRHMVFGGGLLPTCDSLQDSVGDDSGGDKSMHLEDVIADDTDAIETLIDDISFNELFSRKFTKLERRIITLAVQGLNQTQIADIAGTSQTQISRFMARIKKKLKEQSNGA